MTDIIRQARDTAPLSVGLSDSAQPQSAERREVVFIDSSITNWRVLVSAIRAGVEVVVLDGSQDGLSQIADWAQSHSGYDAIHVFSHGNSGIVQLGSISLTRQSVEKYDASLSTIGGALVEDGDILLYGCNVAKSEDGVELVGRLSQATGADIAASSDITGNSESANWRLEFDKGMVESESPIDPEKIGSFADDLLKIDTTLHTYSNNTWAWSRLAVDSSENVYLIHKIDFSGFEIKKWNGTNWTTYSTITTTNTGNTSISDDLDIAVDANNHLHIAYRPSDGSGVNDTRGVAYGYYNGSAWSFTWVQNATHSSGWRNFNDPILTTDSSGHAHMVYQYSDETGNYYIRYATNASGSWVAQNVAQGSGGTDEVFTRDIKVAANGDIFVFYGKEDNQNDYGDNLYYKVLSGGNWSAATKIVDSTGNQKYYMQAVTMDANGKIHALYSYTEWNEDWSAISGNSIYYKTNASGSWVTTTISNSTLDETPRLMFAQGNDVYALIASTDASYSSDFRYMKMPAGSDSWQVGDSFTLPGNYSSPDDFYVTASGKFIVAAEDTDLRNIYTETGVYNDYFTEPNITPTLTAISTLGGGTEDTAYTITYAALAAAADEADADGNPISFRIEAVSSGTLTKGGTPAVAGATTLGIGESLVWTPTTNANGTVSAFTVKAWDGAAASASEIQVSLTLTAVNDNPTMSGLPASTTVVEDTPSNLDLSALAFSDVDAGSNDVTLKLAAGAGTLSATAGGSVAVSGSGTGTLTLTGAASDIDTFLDAASNIQYTGAANACGTAAAAITLVANDGGNTGPGGGSDVTLGTVDVDITGAADTPSVTGTSTTPGTQSGSGLVISRAGVDGAEVTHFKITGIAGGTLYKNDGTTPIAEGSFITFAEGHAGLKFTPSGAGDGSFAVQAATSGNDGGLGGASATATIAVGMAVENKTFDEDTDSGAIAVTKGGSETHFKVTGITGGTLYSDAGCTTAVDDGDFIAWGGASTLNLYFRPIAHRNTGQGGDGAFTLQASHDGATVTGSAVTSTLTLTAVNDSPTVANALGDQNANVDQAFSLTFPANAFADPDTDQALTYTATQGDGSPLPAWLEFNAATRTFTGTPALGDLGTLPVKVTATDNGPGALAAFDAFDIVIAEGPSVSGIVRETGSSATTHADSLSFTVTFSQAVTGVTADDFQLASTGTASGTIGVPTSSDGGTTWTVPVSAVAGDGGLRLDLQASGTGIQNTAATPVAIVGGYTAGETFTVDNTAPTVSFSALAFSADTGATAADFITQTAGQTLTAALSGAPAGTDTVYGSLDNGATWTDITDKVAGTTLTWDGITLTGSGTLKLKVADEAGNDGPVASQAYALDTTAPTLNASGSTPADNAASASISGDITIKFAEPLHSGSDTTKVYLNDAASSTLVPATVSINGSGDLVLRPTSSLAYSTAYYVTWDASALLDTAGNAAIPVSDTTTFNFTTQTPPSPGGGGGGSPSTDDGDDIPATTETQVPGLPPTPGGAPAAGDGNGDGKSDAEQPNVTSVPFLHTDTAQSNPGGAPPVFITLVSDSVEGKAGTAPAGASILKEVRQLDAPADKPAGVEMPLGLLSFKADVASAGGSEDFSLYIDGKVAINGYWKQNTAGAWVNLASAQYGGKVVSEGDKTRLDFVIADGGEFDDDGAANGVISDPGAPAWLPATGQVIVGTNKKGHAQGLAGSDDLLIGLGGGDVLTGSSGNDWLVGDAGTDTYAYTATALGSGDLNAGGLDVVVDAAGSRIQLSPQVLAQLKLGGKALQAFTGTAAVGATVNADNSLALSQNVLQIDLNADGLFSASDDFQILFHSRAAPTLKFNGKTGLFTLGGKGAAVSPPMEGSSGLDTLVGDAKANRLLGQAGDDRLYGAGGRDTLQGGSGDDVLVGGAGTDRYVWAAGEPEAGGIDQVIDGRGSQLGFDSALLGQLKLQGQALSAITGRKVALGDRIDADNSLAYGANVLQVDLNGDGQFAAADDFQIGIVGKVKGLGYSGVTDLITVL